MSDVGREDQSEETSTVVSNSTLEESTDFPLVLEKLISTPEEGKITKSVERGTWNFSPIIPYMFPVTDKPESVCELLAFSESSETIRSFDEKSECSPSLLSGCKLLSSPAQLPKSGSKKAATGSLTPVSSVDKYSEDSSQSQSLFHNHNYYTGKTFEKIPNFQSYEVFHAATTQLNMKPDKKNLTDSEGVCHLQKLKNLLSYLENNSLQEKDDETIQEKHETEWLLMKEIEKAHQKCDEFLFSYNTDTLHSERQQKENLLAVKNILSQLSQRHKDERRILSPKIHKIQQTKEEKENLKKQIRDLGDRQRKLLKLFIKHKELSKKFKDLVSPENIYHCQYVATQRNSGLKRDSHCQRGENNMIQAVEIESTNICKNIEWKKPKMNKILDARESQNCGLDNSLSVATNELEDHTYVNMKNFSQATTKRDSDFEILWDKSNCGKEPVVEMYSTKDPSFDNIRIGENFSPGKTEYNAKTDKNYFYTETPLSKIYSSKDVWITTGKYKRQCSPEMKELPRKELKLNRDLPYLHKFKDGLNPVENFSESNCDKSASEVIGNTAVNCTKFNGSEYNSFPAAGRFLSIISGKSELLKPGESASFTQCYQQLTDSFLPPSEVVTERRDETVFTTNRKIADEAIDGTLQSINFPTRVLSNSNHQLTTLSSSVASSDDFPLNPIPPVLSQSDCSHHGQVIPASSVVSSLPYSECLQLKKLKSQASKLSTLTEISRVNKKLPCEEKSSYFSPADIESQDGKIFKIPKNVPSLSKLLQNATIQPGHNVLSLKKNDKIVYASLTAKGIIQGVGGEQFKTPAKWMSAVCGVPIKNSAAYQKIFYKGNPLLLHILNTRHFAQIKRSKEAHVTHNGKKHCSLVNFTTDKNRNLLTSKDCGDTSVFQLTELFKICKVQLINNGELILEDSFLPTNFWNMDFSKISLADSMWSCLNVWN